MEIIMGWETRRPSRILVCTTWMWYQQVVRFQLHF